MSAVTMPEPTQRAHPAAAAHLVDDGGRQLLQAGLWIVLVGAIAALLTRFALGGIGIHGPHTNSGWLALMVALMCLPFGAMLTLLGGAKCLRQRRLRR